ncbi:DUF983 domain-containing protein [Amycolatopsis balhimycina DSM 5908]|jgi:hypothetical protein|uniref:DUF983 domain-containing protein n=2 Tax=Amycolatopsis TaxID=1813 RepID=A0A428W6F9_AMYBA|nr:MULTISPECIES: hypothetical protein [Amycolatopsis]OXM71233.1 DUF983 domain-containing protein [Amycolatopsis vastitatis]RSM38701.1 DUF983 domain-containing protein [Amycolatopsis balhimycina DSM 5908]WIX86946.1 DUF983 domain-containing protein [Amycolatopsis sp. DG1A-15b]
MNRLVRGEDGRDWVVRAQMEWRAPATADDFEHDVAGSYGPGIAMIVVTTLLAVILVVWTPDQVNIPAWVLLALLLVVLFFPLRWILRRPWTVVAETEGDVTGDRPSERWVGTIRGMFTVQGEVKKISKTIQRHSLPDFDGPLHPVE